MTLSVIIVNYNVKYFLEQCLISVFKAVKGIDAEVWVVDNASADGSCQMVKERFPKVKLIENHNNVGFSVANNQAIRLSTGKYILLLNPDTVVQEDTFTKCIAFMESHPEAGSMTVRMIDGKGTFLPESKRALPSPMVSFYKIFGLSRLFPRSKTFARYHLGHLDPNLTHSIEILPGAYMLMRKEALDVTGLLDETFFMYGEDIDLSYRILKAGYKNYYYPETTIIHYKGESTKKGSINYVLIFYKAMAIFAQKHFSKKNARLYILIIYIAIYFRAFASIVSRLAKRLALPLADTLLISTGVTLLVSFWEQYRFGTSEAYPNQLLWVMIP
ncbi:MAG TPA: glycosyltransferase family 2 protein, partial [Tenuifilaceae bacterium]|nr:glycosyltransferase family 2 protein [Tenuifilaceae bacterium]